MLVGEDLEQDHVFGVFIRNNNLPQQFDIALLVKAVQVMIVIGGQVEMPAADLGKQHLVGEHGREALHFDQLWFQAALRVLADTKIKSNEVRMGIFAGHVQPVRNRRPAVLQIFGCCDHVNDPFAGIQHLMREGSGNEDRGFGNAEIQLPGVLLFHVGYKGPVFFFGELIIKPLPDFRDHTVSFH